MNNRPFLQLNTISHRKWCKRFGSDHWCIVFFHLQFTLNSWTFPERKAVTSRMKIIWTILNQANIWKYYFFFLYLFANFLKKIYGMWEIQKNIFSPILLHQINVPPVAINIAWMAPASIGMFTNCFQSFIPFLVWFYIIFSCDLNNYRTNQI